MTIGGKMVSYEMLYAILTNRFHSCMRTESSLLKEPIESDRDLVHQFCRRERLTLYNFLRMHVADQHRSKLTEVEEGGFVSTLNEERIKDLIHKEYQHYFKRP